MKEKYQSIKIIQKVVKLNDILFIVLNFFILFILNLLMYLVTLEMNFPYIKDNNMFYY